MNDGGVQTPKMNKYAAIIEVEMCESVCTLTVPMDTVRWNLRDMLDAKLLEGLSSTETRIL